MFLESATAGSILIAAIPRHIFNINRTYAEIDPALTPSPSPVGEGRKNQNFAPLLLREKRCPELVEGGLGDEGEFHFT